MLKIIAVFVVTALAVSSSLAVLAQQLRPKVQEDQKTITIVDNSVRPAETKPPEQKPPEHTGIDWSNWALVLVGATTFVAVSIQANESRKATKAMNDSFALQEKAMEQWIELTKWRSRVVRVPLGSPAMPYLLINVEIVNKTQFPVTLKKAEIEFINGQVKHTYFAGNDTFLTPSTPQEVVVATQLNEDQLLQFPLGGVGMRITGRFHHIGALNKMVVQEVSGQLVCRESETVFIPEIHMNPKSDDASDGRQAQ